MAVPTVHGAMGRRLLVLVALAVLPLFAGAASALAQEVDEDQFHYDLPRAEPGDIVTLTGNVDVDCLAGTAEIGFTDLTSEQISDDFPAVLMTANRVILAQPEEPGPFSLEIVIPEPDFPDPVAYGYCLHEPFFEGDLSGSGRWGPYTFGSLPGDVIDPNLPGPDVLPGQPPFEELRQDQEFRTGRPRVVTAVPTAAEAPWDPQALLWAVLIAGGLVFLIVFPSELFNATFEEHHDEIMAGVRRRLPFLRSEAAATVVPAEDAIPPGGGDAGNQGRGWAGFLLVTAGSALLYGLLDPGFGVNKASAVLVIGVGAGVAFSTLMSAGTSGWLAKRRYGRADYWFKVLPATLLVAALCVAVSRLVGFLPGYLYGLVGGIAFRKALEKEDEVRMVVVSAVAVLGASLVGWLLYGVVAERIADGSTGLVWLVAEAILAGTFIAGVEGLLFGLLPLRYLPGEKLLRASKGLWAAVYVPVLLVFVHLIARPAAADDSSAVDWLKTLVLFGAFGVASVAFWAYWRRRDERGGRAPAEIAGGVGPS